MRGSRYLFVVVVGFLLLFASPLASPQKVVITVAAWGPNGDALADAAKEFMKEHPEIEVRVLPMSWDTLLEKLTVDFATRTGAYDIFTWDLIWAGAFSPHAYEIDELMKKYPDVVQMFPNYNWSDYLPAAMSMYSLWKGKRYGVPLYGAAMVFFYRKDLFEDPKIKELYRSWIAKNYEDVKKELEGLGISPKEIPKELKVPETNGELIVISRFFTKKYNPDSPTEYGVALMAKRTHVIFYMYLNFFGPLRRSPEGIKKFGKVVPEYGEYFTEWGTPAFNSSEGVKALLIYKDLTKYAPAPFSADYPETLEYFGKGLTAMLPSWTAVYASLEAYPAVLPLEKKVGIAMIPGGTPCSGGWGVSVSKYSKHPKEAFMFLLYATTAKWGKHYAIKYGIGPTRYSVFRDPEVKKIAWAPVLEEAIEKASNRPRIPEEPKLDDLTAGYFSDALTGAKDPATVVKELAIEWMKVLKR